MSGIRTALLSVYDKTGLTELARALAERGVRLVSTGGTARHLRESGLEVTPLEQLTGQAEMLGGRVKTLHPHVFAGILARREDPAQMAELEAAGIAPIDLVAVNLYPFESTVARAGHTLIDGLEHIDIGGVSLLRAATKNFPGVIVAADPADYEAIVEAIDVGAPSLAQRLAWARKSVAQTARYEAAICNWLCALGDAEPALERAVEQELYPQALGMVFRRVQPLRYGENPHQAAALYAGVALPDAGLSTMRQLQGKELSFNNLLDLEAAWHLAWALPSPGVAIIKHANPCGAARGTSLVEAYVHARATDPTSAFGGIVGANREVDEATAREICSTFIEVVVAPAFTAPARDVLASKPGLRLLELPPPGPGYGRLPDMRFVSGALLIQERDGVAAERWEVVSARAPTAQEDGDLRFVWTVVPAVRSNAIVIGREGRLLGVGAGQMSRVDACRFAAWKAREAGHDLEGSVAASDAFFPFADGLEALAEAGVRAVVQPGGSKRDGEVVAAADRLGLALVHTGTRHFRH